MFGSSSPSSSRPASDGSSRHDTKGRQSIAQRIQILQTQTSKLKLAKVRADLYQNLARRDVTERDRPEYKEAVVALNESHHENTDVPTNGRMGWTKAVEMLIAAFHLGKKK